MRRTEYEIDFEDRRSIDPPPVIELRIVETASSCGSQKNDITLNYNAEFFLLATLEATNLPSYRQGTERLSSPLVGERTASVAHLKRPFPAGYFVFPDLAVRNEGQYQLRFSLFEKTKFVEYSDNNLPIPASPQASCSTRHLHGSQDFRFRLEVRSVPFIVFRPKEFPGLLTSTSLSHILASQGCRIRIRGAGTKSHGQESKRQIHGLQGSRMIYHPGLSCSETLFNGQF